MLSGAKTLRDRLRDRVNGLGEDSNAIDAVKALGSDLFNNIPQTFSSAANLYSTVESVIPTDNKQRKSFTYFEAMQKSKILISLQTPYRFYSSMVIESLRMTQTRETDTKSEIEVTLKEYRAAETGRTAINRDNPSTPVHSNVAQREVVKDDNGNTSSLQLTESNATINPE